MEQTKITCQNCETPIDETFSFCPNCGQKTEDDLTIGVLFSNTISNYFSYDARFLKSFIPLTFKPGFVAKEFVKGKRLKYLHPAQYYLFISVVFFFLFSISTRTGQESVDQMLQKSFEDGKTIIDTVKVRKSDSTDIKETVGILKNSKIPIPKKDLKDLEDKLLNLDSLQQDDGPNFNSNFSTLGGESLGKKELKTLDSLIKIEAPEDEKLAIFGVTENTNTFRKFLAKQALKMYENSAQGILGAFYDIIPVSMFFLIPIFALILKLLYYRRGSFAHSMVFSFYYFTFLFIVLSLILLVNFVIDIPNWIDILIGLSTILYLLISMKRFYEQPYFLTFIKMGILIFTYFMFIIPFSIIAMLIIALLTY